MRKMIAVSKGVAQQAATAVLCREVVTSTSKYQAMLRWPPLDEKYHRCCLGFVMFMQFYNRPPSTNEDWAEVKRLQTEIKTKLCKGSPCMPIDLQDDHHLKEVFIKRWDFSPQGYKDTVYLNYIGQLLNSAEIRTEAKNGFCDFYFTIWIKAMVNEDIEITESITHVMKIQFGSADTVHIFDLSFKDNSGQVAKDGLNQEVWDRIKFYRMRYSQKYIDNGFIITNCLVQNIYAVYYEAAPQ
jgi:hypothetical protein